MEGRRLRVGWSLIKCFWFVNKISYHAGQESKTRERELEAVGLAHGVDARCSMLDTIIISNISIIILTLSYLPR